MNLLLHSSSLAILLLIPVIQLVPFRSIVQSPSNLRLTAPLIAYSIPNLQTRDVLSLLLHPRLLLQLWMQQRTLVDLVSRLMAVETLALLSLHTNLLFLLFFLSSGVL